MAACDTFPPPEKTHAAWVARDMVMNGVPMSVLQLDSGSAPALLLAHYRRLWQQGGQVIEYPLEPWQVAATARARCFYTLQVRATPSGSTGLLAVSQPPTAAQAAPSTRFPMPSGSSVLSDIQHRDGIKNGRTVFLRNRLTLDSNASYYRNVLTAQGWTIERERSLNTPLGPSRIFDLARGAELAMLTVRRSEGYSHVLFNTIDRP
jgi:hypothetical protein